MAKTKKRKPRKEFVKKLDTMQPILLEQLGTEEDPCFGKLYDQSTKECQRCGDCEFCAIAMGQLNHVSRATIEKKSAFKDIEEKEIKSKLPAKEVKKLVKARIYEMAKQEAKLDVIAMDIFTSFAKDGWRKKRAYKYIKFLAKKFGKITINNRNQVVWISSQ